MQIQVNTSNGLENKESFEHWAEAEIRQSLHRFAGEVTRIEIHMSDESRGSKGPEDLRCVMEARLVTQQPVAVTHQAGDMDAAFHGATDKLRRLLDSKLGRLANHRDRATIRTASDTGPPESPGD